MFDGLSFGFVLPWYRPDEGVLELIHEIFALGVELVEVMLNPSDWTGINDDRLLEVRSELGTLKLNDESASLGTPAQVFMIDEFRRDGIVKL